MSELTELSLTDGVLDLRPSKDSVFYQLLRLGLTFGKIATSIYVLEEQSKPQATTDNSREWLQKQFDEIKDILMDKATTPQIGK